MFHLSTKVNRLGAKRHTWRKLGFLWACGSIGLSVLAWGGAPFPAIPAAASERPARYTYGVVRTYPQNPRSFRKGLVVQGGLLCEATRLYGRSTLEEWRLETGEPLRLIRLPDVLNAITYDAQTDRLSVTGKLWPRLFEIRVVPVR